MPLRLSSSNDWWLSRKRNIHFHHLTKAKREEAPKHFLPWLSQTSLYSLLQEAQDRLRQLVGLGQDRGTGLLQDLVLAQRCGFGGVIGILDTAFCC